MNWFIYIVVGLITVLLLTVSMITMSYLSICAFQPTVLPCSPPLRTIIHDEISIRPSSSAPSCAAQSYACRECTSLQDSLINHHSYTRIEAMTYQEHKCPTRRSETTGTAAPMHPPAPAP